MARNRRRILRPDDLDQLRKDTAAAERRIEETAAALVAKIIKKLEGDKGITVRMYIPDDDHVMIFELELNGTVLRYNLGDYYLTQVLAQGFTVTEACTLIVKEVCTKIDELIAKKETKAKEARRRNKMRKQSTDKAKIKTIGGGLKIVLDGRNMGLLRATSMVHLFVHSTLVGGVRKTGVGITKLDRGEGDDVDCYFSVSKKNLTITMSILPKQVERAYNDGNTTTESIGMIFVRRANKNLLRANDKFRKGVAAAQQEIIQEANNGDAAKIQSISGGHPATRRRKR